MHYLQWRLKTVLIGVAIAALLIGLWVGLNQIGMGYHRAYLKRELARCLAHEGLLLEEARVAEKSGDWQSAAKLTSQAENFEEQIRNLQMLLGEL